MLDGNADAWEEYCKLQKEVKDLVRKKKTDIWNDAVEKVNTDYEGSRKEFWAFAGRRSKGKKKTLSSHRSDKGVLVTSTTGKIQVLQSIIRTWVGCLRIVILTVNGESKLKLK